MKQEFILRRDLVRTGSFLRDRGYIVASDGNMSVRLSRSEFLITPTGVDKGTLHPSELVPVKIGKESSLVGIASSEIFIHSLAYAKRPDIGAVIHAHPPFLTGVALAKFDLSEPLLPEVIETVGPIGMVEYQKPGSKELAAMVGEAIANHNALILAHHGALTVGKDLTEALWRLERCELLARSIIITRLLQDEKIPAEK